MVVLRYLGRIRAGLPATMVEDGRERVLVYVPHGARWFGAPEPAAGRSERVRAIEPWLRVPAGRAICGD